MPEIDVCEFRWLDQAKLGRIPTALTLNCHARNPIQTHRPPNQFEIRGDVVPRPLLVRETATKKMLQVTNEGQKMNRNGVTK